MEGLSEEDGPFTDRFLRCGEKKAGAGNRACARSDTGPVAGFVFGKA